MELDEPAESLTISLPRTEQKLSTWQAAQAWGWTSEVGTPFCDHSTEVLTNSECSKHLDFKQISQLIIWIIDQSSSGFVCGCVRCFFVYSAQRCHYVSVSFLSKQKTKNPASPNQSMFDCYRNSGSGPPSIAFSQGSCIVLDFVWDPRPNISEFFLISKAALCSGMAMVHLHRTRERPLPPNETDTRRSIIDYVCVHLLSFCQAALTAPNIKQVHSLADSICMDDLIQKAKFMESRAKPLFFLKFILLGEGQPTNKDFKLPRTHILSPPFSPSSHHPPLAQSHPSFPILVFEGIRVRWGGLKGRLTWPLPSFFFEVCFLLFWGSGEVARRATSLGPEPPYCFVFVFVSKEKTCFTPHPTPPKKQGILAGFVSVSVGFSSAFLHHTPSLFRILFLSYFNSVLFSFFLYSSLSFLFSFFLSFYLLSLSFLSS